MVKKAKRVGGFTKNATVFDAKDPEEARRLVQFLAEIVTLRPLTEVEIQLYSE